MTAIKQGAVARRFGVVALLVFAAFALARPAPAQGCVIPPAGLVSLWPGDGSANDVQNGNDGVLNGATFAPGMVGQAFGFDGVDDYVSFESVPLTATDDWTLEAWINPATLPQLGIAVSNGADDGVTGDGYAFGVGDGTGGVGSNLQGLFPGIAWFDSGYTFPAANQWYHVAMVRESGTTMFYVDGVQTPNTSTIGPAVPTQFRIGSQTGIRYFAGGVDDLAVYNRALTAADVQAIVNAGSAGKCKISGAVGGITVRKGVVLCLNKATHETSHAKLAAGTSAWTCDVATRSGDVVVMEVLIEGAAN